MILTIAIQKGGVGKTTTAAALTQAAAFRGQKVLAVDLDPQAQLSFTLAADTDRPGSLELLQGAPPDSLIQATGSGADVIAGSWSLSTMEGGRGAARRLQKALTPIKAYYDCIIIDTPPTPGILMYNALQAATGLLIPLQADVYNIQGLYQVLDTAEQISGSNPALDIKGIILTQYDGRTTLSRQMLKAIRDGVEAAGLPFLGTIRQAIAVKEAAALQVSLFDYAPRSNPAQDYMELFEKLFTQEDE